MELKLTVLTHPERRRVVAQKFDQLSRHLRLLLLEAAVIFCQSK
jgi:hypothetical protein